MPANAGIQVRSKTVWIPASAGMTEEVGIFNDS
jgi:hypothetical protein